MASHIIGIDGGNSGGIAVLKDGKIVGLDVMPTMKTTTNRNEYDCGQIITILSKYDIDDTLVVLEKAHAMPKLGTIQAFNFGKSYGQMLGILVAMGFSHHIVHSRTWQTKLFRDQPHRDTKKASEIIAKRLFPKESFLATERSKKAHDGLTDATLIAYYGYKNL
jgi:crossover junction endodeoxyribonuclease RuvC